MCLAELTGNHMESCLVAKMDCVHMKGQLRLGRVSQRRTSLRQGMGGPGRGNGLWISTEA